MCLGIPMEVRAIQGLVARCAAKGIERDVSLFLLADEGVEPGDHVLVHVGYAIQKLLPEEARETLEALQELETLAELEAMRDADDDGRRTPGADSTGGRGPQR